MISEPSRHFRRIMLYLRNARLFTHGAVLTDAALLIEAGKIIAAGPAADLAQPADAEVRDARGLSVAPCFIDLQVNGAFGSDFTEDPDSIWQVAAQLPQYGVTAFLPTIITSPSAQVAAAQATLVAGPPAAFNGARPLGLHLEGPFLNPEKKGAHNPDYLQAPSLDAIADWSPDSGVRLVTLAPELPGATEMISSLVARGVVVSAGHSMASYRQAVSAFDAGVSYGTHLFNAMVPIHHRDPGLATALLSDRRCTVGLIPDGIHVHPALVRLVAETLGPDRLSVVTDAMAAMGMPPGTYRLGDADVTVADSTARLSDGTLAGCVVSLDTALRLLMAFTGWNLEQALPTVTTTPARLLQLPRKGGIAAGIDADLVFLDDHYQVVATMVGGQFVYQREHQ